jgi:hypothetical protein
MKMKITRTILIFLCFFSAVAHAEPQENRAKLPPILPREQEIELAKSAAPRELSDKATIYALEAKGYVKVQDGTNGFTCLISRETADSLEPECYDAEGTATFLPRVLREAELRAQGKSKAEIEADTAARFADGTYRAPSRPGIIYMLSKENKVVVDDATGKVAPYVPHLMFYAPYLKNADIGVTSFQNTKVFIIREGTPHALMIVPVPTGKNSEHH